MSDDTLRDELARRHHRLECGCTDRTDEHWWPYIRRANALMPAVEQARADDREQIAQAIKAAYGDSVWIAGAVHIARTGGA